MVSAVKLGELTVGEQLYLSRRRIGETHKQAAKRWGVCNEVYLNWEIDRPGRFRPDLTKLPQLTPTAPESCVLARRRWNNKMGLKRADRICQGKLAEALGITRLWVCRMEVGREDCERLVDYWSDNQC